MSFDMKYIDADRLRAELEKRLKNTRDYMNGAGMTFKGPKYYKAQGKESVYDAILNVLDSLQQEQVDMGEVSDGYHTFNELYYYRLLYNAAFFNLLPKEWVHKSKRHHTGEECFGGGWFIVMANLPTGQISNHYELKDWDLFKVPEREFADEWDGHTPQEAAERLSKYLQQEQLDVDLKKEVKEWVDLMVGASFPERDGDYISEEDYRSVIRQTACHFYELGLKARKEE